MITFGVRLGLIMFAARRAARVANPTLSVRATQMAQVLVQ